MEGIYAKLETSKGTILIELTYQQTPGTVGNFVSLAEGTQKNDHKKEGEPYYDGLKFHRVIARPLLALILPWIGTSTPKVKS